MSTQRVQDVLSTAGKFCTVSNFTYSPSLTLAACSYALFCLDNPQLMNMVAHEVSMLVHS